MLERERKAVFFAERPMDQLKGLIGCCTSTKCSQNVYAKTIQPCGRFGNGDKKRLLRFEFLGDLQACVQFYATPFPIRS